MKKNIFLTMKPTKWWCKGCSLKIECNLPVQNEKIQNHTSRFWCSYLLFYSPIKQNFHQLKRFSAVCKTSLSDNSVQVIVTAVQENKYVQFTRLKTHFKNFATCTLRMDKLSFMQLKILPLTSDSQCIVLSYMLDKTV